MYEERKGIKIEIRMGNKDWINFWNAIVNKVHQYSEEHDIEMHKFKIMEYTDGEVDE